MQGFNIKDTEKEQEKSSFDLCSLRAYFMLNIRIIEGQMLHTKDVLVFFFSTHKAVVDLRIIYRLGKAFPAK